VNVSDVMSRASVTDEVIDPKIAAMGIAMVATPQFRCITTC